MTTLLSYLAIMALVLVVGPMLPPLTLPPILIAYAFLALGGQRKTE
jgi:hypothetical protein